MLQRRKKKVFLTIELRQFISFEEDEILADLLPRNMADISSTFESSASSMGHESPWIMRRVMRAKFDKLTLTQPNSASLSLKN